LKGRGPVYLFTDFGWGGPYVGQMLAVLAAECPGCAVISLMHDAPAMGPDLAAYLLPAVCSPLPAGGIVVAVVDPGVGGDRAALLVETADRLYLGPDNGLLALLPGIRGVRQITWRPERLSATFHGRDLFAPAAAALARGEWIATRAMQRPAMVGADWPRSCARVIYVDGYGNLMTGIDPDGLVEGDCLRANGRVIRHARTFSEAGGSGLFWYLNSQGLVEIAARGGSAARILSLELGDSILLD
jgi:S-adenosylmethionine hydrolase